MMAPELLLRMFPEEALRAMIDEKLIRPLQAGYLRLGKPTYLGSTKTAVNVTLDKTRAPIELWDRIGSYDFEYDRLDLDAFTQGMDKRLTSFPSSDSLGVLQGLLSPHDIPVVKKDVVDAVYTDLGPVTVLAHEYSYRWLGEVTVDLLVALIQIDQKLIVKHISIPFDRDYKSSTVKARMVQQLNIGNANALPELLDVGMFDVTNVAPNGPIGEAFNTKATLVFKNNPYVGQVDITYPRRAFERTWRWPLKLVGGEFANKQDLASKISLQMGCEILPSDIKSEPAPALEVDAVTQFIVSFAQESLAYIGDVLVDYRRTT